MKSEWNQNEIVMKLELNQNWIRMKLEWNWNWIRMKWEWNRNEVELICCSRWVVTARRRAFQCRHWPWIDFRFRFHFRSARICCGAIHFPVCRPPLPDSRPPLRSLTSNNNSPAPSVTFKSININPNQSQSIPISFSFLFFFEYLLYRSGSEDVGAWRCRHISALVRAWVWSARTRPGEISNER